MGIWPELHTCILSTKSKSVKENETRVNTPQSQFTYKLQKTNKQTKTKKKQNKTKKTLSDLPNLERKEKETSRKQGFLRLKTCFFLFFIRHFSRFHGNSFLNQLVSVGHFLFLFMCDFIFLKVPKREHKQPKIWALCLVRNFSDVFGVNFY